MWQELIITDLTRMSGDKVCIAGITVNNKTIRPDFPPPGILENHLYQENKVIVRPKAKLKMYLEPKRFIKPPHTEDHHWTKWEQIELIEFLSSENWNVFLQNTMSPSANAIFEGNLQENKYSLPNTGKYSLGTIKPDAITSFSYNSQFGSWSYRLSFIDASGEQFSNISITDLALRYYVDYLRERKNFTPYDISRRLFQTFTENEIWLRLGLGRPFKKDAHTNARCYLQVNGIYTFPDYLEGKCFADFK